MPERLKLAPVGRSVALRVNPNDVHRNVTLDPIPPLNRLPQEALIGIIAGGVVLVALVAISCCCCCACCVCK